MNKHILILLISIIANQCYSQSLVDSTKTNSAKLTISSKYSKHTFPEAFEAAFYDSTIIISEGEKYLFSPKEIGKLKMESGKLIVCDPVNMAHAIAFKYSFPNGNYPVELAYATHSQYGKRVAFSRVVFSDKEVANWKFALEPNQADIKLIDTLFYCFPVDAGTALFIDQKTNNLFNQKSSSLYNKVFIDKAAEVNYDGFIYQFDNHNFATFPTGFGDGCYAVYIGLDKDGKICKVLIDFAMINWWEN